MFMEMLLDHRDLQGADLNHSFAFAVKGHNGSPPTLTHDMIANLDLITSRQHIITVFEVGFYLIKGIYLCLHAL